MLLLLHFLVAPVGIASTSTSLVFFGFRIAKAFLKTVRKKRIKHNKIVFFLARSKFNNSIEKIISKAFSYAKISHKETL